MAKPLRLFIALELPGEVRDALSSIQAHLRDEAPPRTVRWTRPEGIHLTLKFLGDTDPALVNSLLEGLRAAANGHAPLALKAAGLGCFPNTNRPRVVWAGLQGDLDPLKALQAGVEAAINPLGFKAEDRGFSPHLTLGRVRREADKQDARVLGGLIAGMDAGELAAWTADRVSLMRSDLHPDGARYTCLGEVGLG